ncbi:hypothetical protein CONLIGDRAFT_168521 [Coniochaeta ligniaria NRRL 30616]|uniref:Uncharacterized protein n=1 Tax=Coniochaeta ligniaria NRRL 30616 TaxID=1408157 RepID=A0A1J7IZU4_9PEZI|nr:hypothetical protein CONLIGDRAFT_168521 [Coniochaeta ligniaria NRRL 30616]
MPTSTLIRPRLLDVRELPHLLKVSLQHSQKLTTNTAPIRGTHQVIYTTDSPTMDDLYWETFGPELPDMDDPNLGFDEVNFIGSFPPCSTCKTASRLCRTCKLKLLFLRRQKQRHATQSRKSHLERLCSAEPRLVSGIDTIFLQHMKKVTMPKPAPNGEQGEESLTSEFETPVPAHGQAMIQDDSEDEDDSEEIHYPEPGDTDDGVFECTLSSGTPISFCRTVWVTRQRPSSFMGLQVPKPRTLRFFVYDVYDVAYSKSTAHAVGAWASRHRPPLYSRVWYWMQQMVVDQS